MLKLLSTITRCSDQNYSDFAPKCNVQERKILNKQKVLIYCNDLY